MVQKKASTYLHTVSRPVIFTVPKLYTDGLGTVYKQHTRETLSESLQVETFPKAFELWPGASNCFELLQKRIQN